MSKKPKYYSHFWNVDGWRLRYRTAQKIRDDFCQYFQLPKCAILVDTLACELQGVEGLYIKGNVILRYGRYKSLNVFTLLHELAHHLQDCESHLYWSDTNHGNSFTRAKRQTATWARHNIDSQIQDSHLNAYSEKYE